MSDGREGHIDRTACPRRKTRPARGTGLLEFPSSGRRRGYGDAVNHHVNGRGVGRRLRLRAARTAYDLTTESEAGG